MRQNVRIIGGVLRGKKLHFPDQIQLRPTPDRVRETLFNWLGSLAHKTCLDAFAGSGALGIEALSRGAQQVTLIEQDRLAYNNLCQIKKNLPSGCNILLRNQDAMQFLATTKEQYDIIFLDPPFATNYLEVCLSLVIQQSILTPAGLVYIESGSPITLAPESWNTLKEKKAGAVYYGLYDPINVR